MHQKLSSKLFAISYDLYIKIQLNVTDPLRFPSW